jgi:hypothetical protein
MPADVPQGIVYYVVVCHHLWLHQRSRGVWISATIAPFIGGHADLHGEWLRHGIRNATHPRSLTMGVIISAIAGLIFGLGLIISGMVNPAKVLNFLDLFGSWDPSLAFVMGAAVAATLVGLQVRLPALWSSPCGSVSTSGGEADR